RHGSDDIGARLMREVRCAHSTAHTERFTRHERVNSVETPAANHVVQRRMNAGSETLLFSDGQFPQGIDGQHVAAIKIGTASFLAPVTCISGSPRIRRAEPAAGGGSDRTYRLIGHPFSVRVRKPCR